MKIVDDDGKEVRVEEVGEIIARGPNIMVGYWNKPEESKKALRDGWLFTGDLGYVDREGYFFIIDRKKDMIIKGGENVFPAEVENALYKHPDVAEAAVVGVPHDVYGEDIVAFVVVNSGANVSEEAIIDHVKTQISSFKAPSQVHFVPELPKSGVGKILRRELRDQLMAEQK